MLRTAFLKINLGLILLISAGCLSEPKRLPYYNTPEFEPVFLKDHASVDKRIGHTVFPTSFTDQDKLIVNKTTVAGKIHVANFIFTSCGNICPIMIDQMANVSKAFEADSNVVLLSYSVTPWLDTPEKLKEYKRKRALKKPEWHFLTGSRGAVYDIARKGYFAEESLGYTKDSTQFLHTEHFILVDGSGRIRGIYNGTLALEADQLIKDIRTLKAEKKG